jgi:hypothetical protein
MVSDHRWQRFPVRRSAHLLEPTSSLLFYSRLLIGRPFLPRTGPRNPARLLRPHALFRRPDVRLSVLYSCFAATLTNTPTDISDHEWR